MKRASESASEREIVPECAEIQPPESLILRSNNYRGGHAQGERAGDQKKKRKIRVRLCRDSHISLVNHSSTYYASISNR